MDKMREDFDKWYESIPSDEWNCLSLFDAWQASRAALVVQLPAQCEATLYQGDFEDGYESGYNECLKDAKENLLKAGIKCS